MKKLKNFFDTKVSKIWFYVFLISIVVCFCSWSNNRPVLGVIWSVLLIVSFFFAFFGPLVEKVHEKRMMRVYEKEKKEKEAQKAKL